MLGTDRYPPFSLGDADPAEPLERLGARLAGRHEVVHEPDGLGLGRGHAPAGPGFWYPPTVLAPVRPEDPAYTEEVFGPVLAAMSFKDEDEAVSLARITAPDELSGLPEAASRQARSPSEPNA